MNLRVLTAIALFALPLAAIGQSSSTYDWRTGNRYHIDKNYDGSTNVRGSNVYNGSQWRTRIEPDGSMRGTDKDGNQWRYDSRSKVYQNYGTGTICRGEGALRTCF